VYPEANAPQSFLMMDPLGSWLEAQGWTIVMIVTLPEEEKNNFKQLFSQVTQIKKSVYDYVYFFSEIFQQDF